MEKATLSFHQGTNFNEQHNNRQIFVPYVDTARTKDNYYSPNNLSMEEAYHILFDKAQAEYNERQKNPARQIKDYYSKIMDSAEEHKQKVREMRKSGASTKRIYRR